MLLAIDIGNSHTRAGVISSGRLRKYGSERTVDAGKNPGLFLAQILEKHRIEHAVLCSVVPGLNARWVDSLEHCVSEGPLVVSHHLDLGVDLNYPNPQMLGADRLANIAGAMAHYGAPFIVIDIGTATTFDVVESGGIYRGGIIAPGPELMLDYLKERAVMLPALSLRRTSKVIGRSTRESMRVGSYWGYVGLLKQLLSGLKKDIKGPKLTVCITGGGGRLFGGALGKDVIYDRNLTLNGLARIYTLNSFDS